MMNDEQGNCEFRTANVKPRFAYFDIRNSALAIRPIRRDLIEADRDMPSNELRMPNRISPTSTFEIHPSNFASLPSQLFYSTQIPACLWFLAKNKAADAKHGFRDSRKQTLFIDARKLAPPTLAATKVPITSYRYDHK